MYIFGQKMYQHPLSPEKLGQAAVLAWWRLCSNTNSSQGKEKKSLAAWLTLKPIGFHKCAIYIYNVYNV
jgi:hypothetical protein